MKASQLTNGLKRRLMYVENKDGAIDGARARIGWVEFSKTGRTLYYRGRSLASCNGGGIRGNYVELETREEYWISGIKKRGSNVHPCESVQPVVDDDAKSEFARLRENI